VYRGKYMAYSEPGPHASAEVENNLLSGQDLPDAVQEASWAQDVLPSEYEPFSEGVLTLYRGDSASIYEDMETETHLSRKDPIYFVDSRSRAQRYAGMKDGSEEVLLEVRIPEEYIDTVASLPVNDIEKAHERGRDTGMQPDTVYFNDVSMGDGEWVASEIPKEWVDITSYDSEPQRVVAD